MYCKYCKTNGHRERDCRKKDGNTSGIGQLVNLLKGVPNIGQNTRNISNFRGRNNRPSGNWNNSRNNNNNNGNNRNDQRNINRRNWNNNNNNSQNRDVNQNQNQNQNQSVNSQRSNNQNQRGQNTRQVNSAQQQNVAIDPQPEVNQQSQENAEN